MDTKTTENLLIKIQENIPFSVLNKLKKNNEGAGFILKYLKCHKDQTVYSKDLSLGSGVSTARIAAALYVLERDGYIERNVCKEDKRKTIVKLTEKGFAKCESIEKEILVFFGKIIEKVGYEKCNEYVDLCKEINDAALEVLEEEESNVQAIQKF